MELKTFMKIILGYHSAFLVNKKIFGSKTFFVKEMILIFSRQSVFCSWDLFSAKVTRTVTGNSKAYHYSIQAKNTGIYLAQSLIYEIEKFKFYGNTKTSDFFLFSKSSVSQHHCFYTKDTKLSIWHNQKM